MLQGLKAFAALTRDYVADNRGEIAEKNGSVLKRVCLCYTILLAVYAIMAYFMFKEPVLNGLYGIFLAGQIVFDLLAKRMLFHKEVKEYIIVQGFCAGFCILVMLFIILISIYPFPDRPAIFFQSF